MPGSLESPFLASGHWHQLLAKSLLGPDLLAEAAEDGEEPQDHVGQGRGIGNIFPGKFIHLEVVPVVGQEETGAQTWGEERGARSSPGQRVSEGAPGTKPLLSPRLHPRTAASPHCLSGWNEEHRRQM